MHKPLTRGAPFDADESTSVVARRLAEDYIRHIMMDQEQTMFLAKDAAKKMNVTLSFFSRWVKGKHIRGIKGFYNLRDIGEVLIASLNGTQAIGGVDGNWNTWGTQFLLGDFDIFADSHGPRPIYIVARPQNEGPVKWAVSAQLDPGWVLTHDMEWIFEPPPTERTAKYLSTTRYDTKEAALKHFVAFKDHLVDKGIFYYE